ncbi:MAG: type II secretion system F family protein [Chromatiales bacterium]|nr:type II secretion system F family protein [Chromatiales bacterium]
MAQAPAAKKSTPQKIKNDVFVWEAVDKKGGRMKGEVQAVSEALARADLRRQGITPLKVKKKPKDLFGPRKKKIKPKDIAVFLRQMATMMEAGVPLVQSFEIIGRGHENPSMAEMILSIKADVEGGATFSSSLAKHPVYFDKLVVSLVAAGEQSGALESLLDKIATYKEKIETLKGKIKKALFYPAAVIVVAIIVSAILLVFVVPQFQDLFRSFGADLPAFTLMVIKLSEFVQAWWWALTFGFVAIGWGLTQAYRRSPAFVRQIDIWSLKIPVIGDILHKAAIARFTRTLATMFSAGVPLVEAMDSVATATGNVIFEEATYRMRDDVATGTQLQLTMRQSNLFPNMVVQMVAIGEESGSLDDMLNKVADFYEEEVDNMVDALSSLLEPMIMVVIGVLVGSLVIAMYLPIFKLGSVI